MKHGLSEHTDFKIVGWDTMEVFANYKGERIHRRAVKLSSGKKTVEIYKLQVRQPVI